MSSDINLEFIPTKSSLLKNKKPDDFKVVVFESHEAKQKKIIPIPEKTPVKEIKENVINLEKARHEIIKFGMSGFDPKKKGQAKVQLAISLGAKPKKNRYKNYKRLQEQRKKEKEILKKQVEFQQLGKKSSGKSNAKGKSFDRKRRKKKDNLLNEYGKVNINKKSNTKK